MRSHQFATNAPGGALPVCLSGIRISPSVILQAQPSSRRRYHHHHRNEAMRPIPSSRQDSRVEPYVISTTEATLDQSFYAMSLNEVFLRHDISQEPRRRALALQMADLDRRREAIKHRSNRGLVNLMVEERTLFQLHSHRMRRGIGEMMQSPSFQSEFVTALQRNSCAKAA